MVFMSIHAAALDICAYILEDGVIWGRIFALFVFALEMGKACKEASDHDFIKDGLLNF